MAIIHNSACLTTGNTKNPPCGAGTSTFHKYVKIAAIEDPNINIGRFRIGSLAAKSIAPSVICVDPSIKFAKPAFLSSAE